MNADDWAHTGFHIVGESAGSRIEPCLTPLAAALVFVRTMFQRYGPFQAGPLEGHWVESRCWLECRGAK